jgi:hypothetical protein
MGSSSLRTEKVGTVNLATVERLLTAVTVTYVTCDAVPILKLPVFCGGNLFFGACAFATLPFPKKNCELVC